MRKSARDQEMVSKLSGNAKACLSKDMCVERIFPNRIRKAGAREISQASSKKQQKVRLVLKSRRSRQEQGWKMRPAPGQLLR